MARYAPEVFTPLNFRLWRLLALLLVGLLSTSNLQAEEKTPWFDQLARILSPQVAQLSRSEQDLKSRLASLPLYTPQEVLRAGYHSQFQPSRDDQEWIQVDLGAIRTFESIVLAPVLLRLNDQQIPGYGFPKRFRVEVADQSDFQNPRLLADFTAEDFPAPGYFPVQIATPGAIGRYVRITFTRLATLDGNHFVAIGELLVISGMRNIAFWRPVDAKSSIEADLRWSTEYLVDEFSVIPAPVGLQKSPSDGFQQKGPKATQLTITIDLGETYPIDEVRLYPAQPTDSPSSPGWGFPTSFQILLSNSPEFEDAEAILDFSRFELRHWTDRPLIIPVASRRLFRQQLPQLHDMRGEVDLPIDPLPARYLRLIVNVPDERQSPPVAALAEMQVYAGDQNVALKKRVTITHSDTSATASDKSETASSRWFPAAIVDDFTSRNDIIELANWLKQIDLRRQYEAQLSSVQEKLAQSRSSFWVNAGVGGGGILILSLSFLLTAILWQKGRIHRETTKLRERIASDLHDDIGSNLGTIALMSRNLATETGIPQESTHDLIEISKIATETSQAMRDMLWIIKPAPLTLEEFISQVRQSATRMLGNLDLRIETPKEIPEVTVDIVWRRNLFLSIKEIFHNLSRHSLATAVSITIVLDRKSFLLEIVDNGVSFDSQKVLTGDGLPNIRKRIAELHGSIEFLTGTPHTTTLKVPLP